MGKLKSWWGVLLLLSSPLIAQESSQPNQTLVKNNFFGEESLDNLSDSSQLNDSTQLELAKIRLLLEKGLHEEGLEKLNALLKKYPDNLELIQMKAHTENQLGRWPEAIETIDKAEQTDKDPEDIEELEELRKDILEGQEEYLSLEGEYKKIGGVRKDYFGFLKGRARLAKFTYLGVDFEHNRTQVRQLTRPKTGFADDVTANRQKGDVYIEHFLEEGHKIQAGLYGAQKVFGGHASFSLADALGNTTLEAKIHRPDWDNSETVVYEGSRDTLSLARLLNFTERLQLTAEGGWNNYNTEDFRNVAQSVTVVGRFGYTYTEKEGFAYLPGKKTALGISYILNAEYPYHLKNKTNVAGVGYAPLSLSRSEAHGFEVNFSTVVTSALEMSAFGGYELSRFIKNSFFAGANLDYTIKEKIQFGFEYENRNDNSNVRINRIRAKLKYLFN